MDDYYRIANPQTLTLTGGGHTLVFIASNQ